MSPLNGSRVHVNEESAPGLARRLKEGTQEAHAAAEKVLFVHEFIKGRILKEAYCQFLVNLQVIYRVLEYELDRHCDNDVLVHLHFPYELNRSEALAADVRFWCGSKIFKPSSAALRYAAQLKEVGDTQPELLISHSYARYLGDLSGGQFLKRALQRTFGLQRDDQEGVRFYLFPGIKDVKAFKNIYRARLDSLLVSDSLASEIVEEANRAFELNTDVFTELPVPDEMCARVRAFSLEDAEVPEPVATSCKGKKTACAVCPFAALLGASMPKGHVKIQVEIEETSCELISQECPMGATVAHGCPLRQFGRRAPKLALVVLPVAFGLMQLRRGLLR